MDSQGERGVDGQPGERGPKGDHGQHGETGSVGQVGQMGQMGHMGERGPKGDHGQPGDTGGVGDTGQTGATGRTGATGKTEPATIWFGVNRWTYAGLAFLLIVSAGAYSTYRTEQRFNDQVGNVEMLIRHIEQASIDTDYRTCLGGNKIRSGIRNVLEGSFEVGNPRREQTLAQFALRDCEGEFPARSMPVPPVIGVP